ncbi:MAG: flagellin lysine-N-methylase [Candidatus Izemoplasmatales bacterium]|nr:flagellin lysine-N-methylase [Candidatus Izemoplasmatales bacterium]
MATNKNVFAKEKINAKFIVPSYYKDFTCKGGDCRDSCCKEWKVTIPMNQYFLLHGLYCNKKVKDKIDRTFRPVFKPTNERYAEIVHTQNGDCPLHKENGYCLLHETCGEEVLPWVCRYYPRGPRLDYQNEASCANSCEKTLELLFADDELISFEEKQLTFLMNKPKEIISENKKNEYKSIRDNCATILSNRNFTLQKRLIHLGIYLKETQNNPLITLDEINFLFAEENSDIKWIYNVLSEVLSHFNGRYPRLLEQLDQVKKIYEDSDIKLIYLKVLEKFENQFPNHEIMFEKMLINDLFFKQFPFQKNFKLWDQYLSICGTYVLLRYLAINLSYSKDTSEDLIDILSKTFTVIDHSEFDKELADYFNDNNLNNLDILAKITLI